MNITITILSCIVLYLVITKLVQRSEIKRLKYRLDYKHKKVNKLVVDNTNKIMVLHVEDGELTPSLIKSMSNDFQELKEKGYYAVVLDKTFGVNQKQFSIELATKLKHELNKEDE